MVKVLATSANKKKLVIDVGGVIYCVSCDFGEFYLSGGRLLAISIDDMDGLSIGRVMFSDYYLSWDKLHRLGIDRPFYTLKLREDYEDYDSRISKMQCIKLFETTIIR